MCWLRHIIMLTCQNVRPHLIRNGQKTTDLYKKAVTIETLFMDLAHGVAVFLLFPEVQKCYIFWHCARLFVYLCIYFISRSPEILCFQALCTCHNDRLEDSSAETRTVY